MEIFLGTGVSRGQEYVPDEVAKAMVKELRLEKGMTIPKREIIAFLAKHDLSPLMATDVAMKLRDMYSVTPTFDEDRSMSATLLEEVRAVLDGNPDRVVAEEAKSSEITMTQALASYSQSVLKAFCEAEDEQDESVISYLSLMNPSDVIDLAELNSYLSEDGKQILDECWEIGGQKLLEDWFAVEARPHTLRFLPESTQKFITERQKARAAWRANPNAAAEKAARRSDVRPASMGPGTDQAKFGGSFVPSAKHLERDITTGVATDTAKRAARSQAGAVVDPLAARQASGQTATDRWAGMSRREKEGVRSRAAAAASERDFPLPASKQTVWDTFAPPPGAKAAGGEQPADTLAKGPDASPEKKPGWTSRVGGLLGRTAAGIMNIGTAAKSAYQSQRGTSGQPKQLPAGGQSAGQPQAAGGAGQEDPLWPAPVGGKESPEAGMPGVSLPPGHDVPASAQSQQPSGEQPKRKQGLLGKILGGAGKLAGNVVGGIAGAGVNALRGFGSGLAHSYRYGQELGKASVRQRSPGLAHVAFGRASPAELAMHQRRYAAAQGVGYDPYGVSPLGYDPMTMAPLQPPEDYYGPQFAPDQGGYGLPASSHAGGGALRSRPYIQRRRAIGYGG